MPAAMDSTSLAFHFNDGIILASYCHRSLKPKTSGVMEIDPYTLCTMVGKPVDELFRTECQQYKALNERRLPVELAANLLVSMMTHHFGMESSGEALIAGWEGESPTLYYVDNGELGTVTGARFSIGPGQFRVYDAFNVGYRYDMSICEAVAFAQWAIGRAAREVGFGNGVASVYYGGINGWFKILGYDVVKIPPSPMHIEDEEKAAKDWQMSLKYMEQCVFMCDAFSMSGIEDSNLPMFESRKNRKFYCDCEE